MFRGCEGETASQGGFCRVILKSMPNWGKEGLHRPEPCRTIAALLPNLALYKAQ